MNMQLLEMEIGGSWIRFEAFRQRGKKLFSLQRESVLLSRIPMLLRKIYQEQKIDGVKTLRIGARGVWTKKEKSKLATKLKPFAGKVEMLSDVEFAYQKIFGEKPGILLIAGTGSIAYGKDGLGKFARAGGLGSEKGDEGSGYWISKNWLRHQRRKNRKMSVREIAARTPQIIQKARSQDKKAKRILNHAWEELAKLVVEVYKKLQFQGVVPLRLYGGLFRSQFFRKKFLKKLRLKRGGRFRVVNSE